MNLDNYRASIVHPEWKVEYLAPKMIHKPSLLLELVVDLKPILPMLPFWILYMSNARS